MQPRQSQAQAVPRGSGRGRGSAASSSQGDAATETPSGSTSARPSATGAAKLLGKAPSAWKGAISKQLAAKAIAGSALADDRPPDREEEDPLAAATQQKGRLIYTWQLGNVYCTIGVLDLLTRLAGMICWRIRYKENGNIRVSDTQREDIGKPILYSDLCRLCFVGTSFIIRCSANLIVLWLVIDRLRPMWRDKHMRMISPAFKILLGMWVIADLLQALIPNVPPDPTEHQITTPHIFFHQMSMLACMVVNMILLAVLKFDKDAEVNAHNGAFWILLIMIFTYIYYTEHLFRGKTAITTPLGWALVVELSFLMICVGRAIPPRIIAVRGRLEKARIIFGWKFRREGRVREDEDTSALTGDKPLLLSEMDTPEMEALEEDATKRKKKKLRLSQEQLLEKQKAELLALNAEIEAAGVNEEDIFHLPEVVCHECGEINRPESKFCRSCGASMQSKAQAKAAPKQGTAASSSAASAPEDEAASARPQYSEDADFEP